MIDQAARKQMADTIRSYLNEEIKSFQFSNALDDIRTQTADATVDLIADILWCFYDDDWLSHKVIASKEEWDYFHRLLLVLESDTELEATDTRKWSLRQPIAACAVVAWLTLALCLGWGTHLLVLSVSFGLVSMLLSYWRYKEQARPDALEIALTPFSSVSQLLAARRRVALFSKRRYPSHLMKRMIRRAMVMSPILWPSRLLAGAITLVFPPAPLILQTVPERNSEIRVKPPLRLEEPSR